MQFLPSSYDPWIVAASFLIATFASYVALDLARRVRSRERRVALSWWAGGSIAMGTGIWCMHFVGMLAFSLPIPLGYTAGLTAASWLAGVGVSAIALFIASRGELGWARLTKGALSMGLGISTMHYTGMAALDMAPGIVWDRRLVAASVLIAVGASAAALTIFFALRRVAARRRAVYQALASVVMGAAICGMHYTGMAAAAFPVGAICQSSGALAGAQLGVMVSFSSVAFLGMTLFTSVLDGRMQSTLKAANASLKTMNEELSRRAFLDPLTGLPNRLLFEDRLAHALGRLERDEVRQLSRKAERIAVLFVDLDGFKTINDSLGHAAGDELLRAAARRLCQVARESDTVARLGGDEFVVLMEGLTGVADAISFANRLIAALAEPVLVSDRQIAVSGSIGVVVYPDYGDKDKLVVNADSAMYAAKHAGGNTYALFESHMDDGALEQLSLQNDLRQALLLGELQLHYQPKIDGTHGQIRGAEALLRWNHPQRGLMSPGLFIPIAERFGLICEIGNWVIDEACRQMREWADRGLSMRVAINLSAYQLRDEGLVSRIEAALALHRIEPSQLLCEITETVAMEDIKSTQRAFDGLSRIGVFLSIDDFGTGYSSLSYLRQLPARQLKIDRTFIADIEANADARAIVSAVIQLAHELGLRVVAEGVETQGQREVLLGLRCDELQGYLFARPMPADSLSEWAMGRKPAGAADFSPSVLGGDYSI